MYSIAFRKSVEEKLQKLGKKDQVQLKAIYKKLEQIKQNPEKFKPLSGNMKGKFRVHILKSFVLIYVIYKEGKTVIVEDYDHHDNVYK